jgi:hypothetical protein
LYLTAHRVRSPDDGRQAIHGFLYIHDRTWTEPPLPEDDPGELAHTLQELPSLSGNDVLSYLDIVAPDLATWTEVHNAFVAFLATAQGDPLPWTTVVGDCLVRFGVSQGLVPQWRSEMAALYNILRQLHAAFHDGTTQHQP